METTMRKALLDSETATAAVDVPKESQLDE